MKLLWFYILDDCDHAGIWEVDLEVASIRIGESFTYEEAFIALGQKITPIGRNKWFIADFIFFQYGELSEKNRMHQSVIGVLNKYNIPIVKGHVSPFRGAKEQEQEKEEDKDKDKVKESDPEFFGTVNPSADPRETKLIVFEELFSDEIYVEQLAMTHRGKNIKQAFEECYTHHANAPNPPRELWEWKQKLNTWLSNTRNGHSKKTNGADAINARRAAFAAKHGTSPGG